MTYQIFDDSAAVAAMLQMANVYTCPVPHMLGAAGVVRRRAQNVLAAWGIPAAAAQEALLVISELVTNAVLYGLPPAELRLCLHRQGVRTVVRVEVANAGAGLASAWPDSAPRARDRGCANSVVKALAIRDGTDSLSGTIIRWAELPAF
ncbi:ATP-binding protein [Sphaerimonospora thailandensis]|uniref:Histidine kinase/HSP90-like ATPase domain-containing protein n=1 Tax=Sphaerimonospora thailandensis TaxID=795644 RepID=A0A8J3RAG6_9ACTN|nr:ATP-binding protein [Sphaerimonospora thailandensis]GIH71438.1 hypothetical protein Mth01_36910 [Sphaerimonospora thailandensis]